MKATAFFPLIKIQGQVLLKWNKVAYKWQVETWQNCNNPNDFCRNVKCDWELAMFLLAQYATKQEEKFKRSWLPWRLFALQILWILLPVPEPWVELTPCDCSYYHSLSTASPTQPPTSSTQCSPSTSPPCFSFVKPSSECHRHRWRRGEITCQKGPPATLTLAQRQW